MASKFNLADYTRETSAVTAIYTKLTESKSRKIPLSKTLKALEKAGFANPAFHMYKLKRILARGSRSNANKSGSGFELVIDRANDTIALKTAERTVKSSKSAKTSKKSKKVAA